MSNIASFCLCFCLVFEFLLFLLFVCRFFLLLACFTRDVWQPLTQIRLSLSLSLGAGQIVFLAGINATENTVSVVYLYMVYLLFRGQTDSLLKIIWKSYKNFFFSLAGSLCPNSSFLAVFPDGSFLLDAGGGNLFRPICCESL